MDELISCNNLSRIEPATLGECVMYRGLDGRIFSYRPQAGTMFYRVLDVKQDISLGTKLLIYENQMVDRIDFEAVYSPNRELPLSKHLNDKLEKEFVPEMIHNQVHVKGPGFGFGFGVIAIGRRMKGKANAQDILKNLPGINQKQVE